MFNFCSYYLFFLLDQATSPNSIETNILNQVQNVEVQTDVIHSSESVIDKAIQTSKTKLVYNCL